MAIIIGTKENFKAEVLTANGIVVVDFGASWCGPCKSLVPILEEVVEDKLFVTKSVSFNCVITSSVTIITFLYSSVFK